MTLLLFLAGLAALCLGAEWLVRGASGLAAILGIPHLLVGLTVVAYGTSAPEIAVSVAASSSGQSNIALGNVVGSNICNTLLILGLAGTLAPMAVARRLVRLEAPLVVLDDVHATVVAAEPNHGDLFPGVESERVLAHPVGHVDRLAVVLRGHLESVVVGGGPGGCRPGEGQADSQYGE